MRVEEFGGGGGGGALLIIKIVCSVLEISSRPIVPDDQKVYRVTRFW